MAWPTQQTKEHADQGTDDPKQWRAEVAAFVDRFNQLQAHVTSFMQTFLSRTDAAGARSDLGLGTAALKNTGTSGDAVPLLNQTVDFSGQMRLSGTISPSQLTADVNNYSPTGLSGASTLRLTSDAERTITGIAGGAGGRLLTIVNVGANDIVLAHQSASSTAANRFLFASAEDLTLEPEQAVTLRYDATTTRWRRLQEVAGAGGAITVATPVSTSGVASADISIPAGVNQVDIVLDDVSTNGGDFGVQLGDSGGIETTGYKGIAMDAGAQRSSTTTVPLNVSSNDNAVWFGVVSMRRVGTSNTWIFGGDTGDTFSVNDANSVTGTKTLSGELTTVRLIVSTGQFDGGQFTVHTQ